MGHRPAETTPIPTPPKPSVKPTSPRPKSRVYEMGIGGPEGIVWSTVTLPRDNEERLVDLRNQAILQLESENQELREQLSKLGRRGWQEWNEEGYIVCSLESWKLLNTPFRVLKKVVKIASWLMLPSAFIATIAGATGNNFISILGFVLFAIMMVVSAINTNGRGSDNGNG